MNENMKLLPLVEAEGREFLVDVPNRVFRDADKPNNVVKMHSKEGRDIVRDILGLEWRSFGVYGNKEDGLEVSNAGRSDL